MNRPARPLTVPLVGFAAALAVLAGCGGGQDESARPASASGPTPSGTTSAGTTSAGSTPVSGSASSSAASSPSAPVPAGPARCATADLAVSLSGGEGAAGSVYRSLVFVNHGGSTCTLDGHPGVSYVAGDDGHQVGSPAGREGAPALVTLAPGAAAHATLRIVQQGVYDPATCRSAAVTGLRVYPPDQTAAAFVPAPGTTCSNPDVVLLTIRPVEPGAGSS